MKILIACECSGITRDAFSRYGHDVWSCDLLPSNLAGKHLQCDVREVLYHSWDMMIAFPPCTYLSYAGAAHFKNPDRPGHMYEALRLFDELLNAPIEKIAIENPRGLASRWIRKPDDCIQPYYFGHPFTKRTYLWLKNLPGLMATNILTGSFPSFTDVVSHRGGARSVMFVGIAEAMASQWT